MKQVYDSGPRSFFEILKKYKMEADRDFLCVLKAPIFWHLIILSCLFAFGYSVVHLIYDSWQNDIGLSESLENFGHDLLRILYAIYALAVFPALVFLFAAIKEYFGCRVKSDLLSSIFSLFITAVAGFIIISPFLIIEKVTGVWIIPSGDYDSGDYR